MEIKSLGYVGIASSRLDEWRGFATELVGMQVSDQSRHSLGLRIDERCQRLFVEDGADVPRTFGWEVESPQSLHALSDRLTAAGVPNEPMATSECARRFVTDGIVFQDPAGNRLECFAGAVLATDTFVPGRTVSGFRTGSQGMGHAVLTTSDPDALITFYHDLLGFRLSDYQLHPFKAFFFHLNERHHSLAIIQSPHVGLHHIMVEMLNLDDVGQAYDIALTKSDIIGVTLGRHSNDNMLSFYAKTPSGFLVECGWGGRRVDVDGWVPEELTIGPSLWGHERGWLPAEKRAEAATMRLQAARDGYRAPVHVYGNNYDIDPVCALWEHLKDQKSDSEVAGGAK